MMIIFFFLFNLYVGNIAQTLPSGARITSYADDSYVSCVAKSFEEAKGLTERCITTHILELRKLGMVVNETKTEIVCFTKSKDPREEDFSVNGKCVKSKPFLKALGITFDHRMKWSEHVKQLSGKVRRLLCGLKIIRKKLTEEQTNVLVTSQVLSVLYYAAPVWLTPHLQGPEIRKIESLHFRSLRIVIRDYRQRVHREWVTASTRRIPPRLWLKFAAASLALKTWTTQTPRNLFASMFSNTYSKNRSPGLLYAFDASKSSIGRSSTRNWIGMTLGQIKIRWTNVPLSKDQIRVIMKKTFEPQFHCRW